MKTLNLKVTESLGIFLQSKRADHCGRDLIDYYLDQPGLEIQVNVARGDGYPVPGKPHRFTDGINEWGPFHIPRNAATKPSFREWRLPWPLELHASAVGSTGWDWKTGQSRYSGFDFDTIVGHAQGVGISQESLDAVREAAKKLPYVSGRRSTGGAGLHLYVHFAEPIPTENHTIHAELARLVLDKMSRDIGFQFLDFADAVGGNMWIWHRKSTPENRGLEPLWTAQRGFTLSDLPTNWEDELAVARGRAKPRRRPAASRNGKSPARDDWFESVADFPCYPLTPEHDKDIEWLRLNGHCADWDESKKGLLSHTKGWKARHIAAGLNGDFDTISEGTDLATPNCIAFPRPHGWLIIRFNTRQETPNWTPTSGGHMQAIFNPPPSSEPEPDTTAEEQDSCSAHALAVFAMQNHELFCTPDKLSCATLTFNGRRETHRIGDESYQNILAAEFFDARRGVLRTSHIRDALRIIKAKAMLGPTRRVFIRYAFVDGVIWIDLGNEERQVVRITPGDWAIEAEAPLLFLRPEGMAALPLPERGGSLEDLRPFINIQESDWPLYLGWLGGCYMPTGTYPIAAIVGGNGRAKSSTARYTKSLIDPSRVSLEIDEDLAGEPANETDLMVHAVNGFLLAFDNLSDVRPRMSDAYCRICSGASMKKRKLYSDSSLSSLRAKRPILLTMVEDCIDREDLRSRTLFFELPELSEMKSEAELNRKFVALWPKLTGTLYDAVAMGLRNYEQTTPLRNHRLADFSVWGQAIEPALPIEQGAFVSALQTNRKLAVETTLEKPLALYIAKLAKGKGFIGTVTELAQALTELGSVDHPTNPTKLSGALDNISSELREGNIKIERERTNTARIVRISRAA